MQIGKKVRMSKWFHGGRTFILAIDQAIPRGVYPQIRPGMSTWTNQNSPWDALVVHQGHVMAYEDLFAGEQAIPFIIKLTSNSKDCPDTTRRGMITNVERAVALGASGVAVNILVGSEFEAQQLTQLGEVVNDCERFGMPLIVLACPADKKDQSAAEKLAYASMIAAEMGADIVKTEFPGSVEGMRQIVEACICPVVIEESPYSENQEGTLLTVEHAMKAGACGVFFGSRVWGEKEPLAIGNQIRDIIDRRKGVRLE